MEKEDAHSTFGFESPSLKLRNARSSCPNQISMLWPGTPERSSGGVDREHWQFLQSHTFLTPKSTLKFRVWTWSRNSDSEAQIRNRQFRPVINGDPIERLKFLNAFDRSSTYRLSVRGWWLFAYLTAISWMWPQVQVQRQSAHVLSSLNIAKRAHAFETAWPLAKLLQVYEEKLEIANLNSNLSAYRPNRPLNDTWEPLNLRTASSTTWQ